MHSGSESQADGPEQRRGNLDFPLWSFSLCYKDRTEGRNEILGWKLPSLMSQVQSLSALTILYKSWSRSLLPCLLRCHLTLLQEDNIQGQLCSVILPAKVVSWPDQKLFSGVPRERRAGGQDPEPHRDAGRWAALGPGLCKFQLESQPQMPVHVVAKSR